MLDSMHTNLVFVNSGMVIKNMFNVVIYVMIFKMQVSKYFSVVTIVKPIYFAFSKTFILPAMLQKRLYSDKVFRTNDMTLLYRNCVIIRIATNTNEQINKKIT